MTPRKSDFERIDVKAARGEYTLIEPLDYIILEALPEEGTLFVGLYPLGETATNVSKAKLGGKVPTGIVARRLATLRVQGLAIKQNAIGAGSNQKNTVWQRSKLGSALLTSRGGKNGNQKSG